MKAGGLWFGGEVVVRGRSLPRLRGVTGTMIEAGGEGGMASKEISRTEDRNGSWKVEAERVSLGGWQRGP